MEVEALYVYPIKGCRGGPVDEAVVEPWGLRGDRRWMIVDAAGRFQSQRRHRSLARITPRQVDGGVELSAPGLDSLVVKEPREVEPVAVKLWDDAFEALPADPDADAWVSAYLEGSYRLVHLDDPVRRPVKERFGVRGTFSDGYPVLATNSASLDALNDWLVEKGEEPVPMARFRPNLVVRDPGGAWGEDRWHELRLPGVTLWVTKPCGRCVVTTYDQISGDRPSREPLWTLTARRRGSEGAHFGVNMAPRAAGRIRVGDPVTRVEA